MSYSSDAAKLSRQSLNIVRLDLDTLISGGSYEYICDGISPPQSPPIYSCIKSIEWIPQRTAVEGGLGYLGEVTITAMDFSWPSGSGTFFGRLLANNPYFLNRKVKIYSGFFSRGDTFSLSNFQERDYFIRDITGPDTSGQVKIRAFDILSQTKEATVPEKTNGVLASGITDSFTGSTSITDTTGFTSSGYAIINSEVVAFTKVDSTNINITSRAQAGTTAAAHSANDPCREIYYKSANVVDTIDSLIDSYTPISKATYINSTDWTNEKNNFLSGETVEVWVTEPTPVSDLINELCQQTYINVFWDDVTQKIKLKAVGPTLTPVTLWNDQSNILDTKITIKRPQKNIYSQCWVYYDKIDKTGGNDAKNFKSLYILVDSDVETGLGTDVIKRIYCSHIPSTGSATASKVASRFISQHKNPIDITFEVDTKDQETVEPGDSIQLYTDLVQSTDGEPDVLQYRVIEKTPKNNNRWRYRCVFSGVEVGSRYALVGPNTLGNYTAESTANQNTYGFISDNDPDMSNGDDPYLIL